MWYRILVVVLLMFILGLQLRLWFGEGSFPKIWQLQQQIEKQQTLNKKLTQRNQKLEAEVQDLKTDEGGAALEERARNDLGMIGKDETFFQLVKPKPQTATD